MKQPQKAFCIATIKHNTFPIDQYTHRPLHCTSNSGSEAVLPSLTLLLGTCLPLLWNPSFPLHAPALISPLSLTLTFSRLTICYFKQTALFHFLLAKAALSYLPTVLSVATLSFSGSPVCSSVSILQALCWSRQHQQVCRCSFPI